MVTMIWGLVLIDSGGLLGHFGSILGRPGALLGPSWVVLGLSLGVLELSGCHLGAILDSSWCGCWLGACRDILADFGEFSWRLEVLPMSLPSII